MNYCEPFRDIHQHNVRGRRIYILGYHFDSDPTYRGLSPLITFKIHMSQWLANTLLSSLSPYASIKYQQSLKTIGRAVARKVAFKKKK